MRVVAPGYYILERKKNTTKQVRNQFALPKGALSFALSRPFVKIALAPDEVKPHTPVHVVFLTDDRSEKGSVIVSLLPNEPQKVLRSYFSAPPTLEQQRLVYANPAHKGHIDSIIGEIGNLLNGSSSHNKCSGKKFAINEIHLKGIEGLDTPLLHYFKNQVGMKYGHDFFNTPRTVKFDFYTLEQRGSSVIDSVEVSTVKEQQKPMSERRFLISCMARNQNFLYWLKDFYTSATQIGCSVIGFNYRGVDCSKGVVWTHEDIVNDAIAQAKRLMSLGVKPKNIAFEGMSLGGAVATIAAAKMHEQGFKVSLYNERSYRSFIRLMAGNVLPGVTSSLWNPVNWFRYALVGFFYLFLAPLIRVVGWHLDAASAWDKIPLHYKEYSVARNHKNREHHDDDDLVHDSYTSIASLVEAHRDEVLQKQKKGYALTKKEQKLLDLRDEERQFTLDRTNSTNTNPSSHSAPRRFLLGTHNLKQTMQDFMIRRLRSMLGTDIPSPTR